MPCSERRAGLASLPGAALFPHRTIRFPSPGTACAEFQTRANPQIDSAVNCGHSCVRRPANRGKTKCRHRCHHGQPGQISGDSLWSSNPASMPCRSPRANRPPIDDDVSNPASHSVGNLACWPPPPSLPPYWPTALDDSWSPVPSVYFRPNLQYSMHPGGTSQNKNAFVVGLTTGVTP